MHLEQAGLRVSNLPRSLRFYSRAFGLREIHRGDTRSWGGGIWVQIQDPMCRRILELNWYPKGSMFYFPYRPGDALDHIDFTLGVASAAQLEREYRRVLRAGATPTAPIPATTEGWAAGVRDPAGSTS